MRRTPLRERHAGTGAELLTYGPPEAGVELVECFGPIELEYAAIRKGAALLDQPNRGVIAVTGADRHTFLNSMITQEIAGIQPGGVRRSFWLERNGRIVADLRVVELDDRTLLDLDVHAVARTIETLGAYIFAEDCELIDETERWHRLALHAPRAHEHLIELENQASAKATIAETEIIAARDDTAGVPGYELFVPAEHAGAVYEHLAPKDSESPPCRPIGWHAYNAARIEAGTPLFNIDFGTDSLPHETGVLDDRVSFTKGCYLGQEIVARIHSRGKPKQIIVALRFERTDETGSDQPTPQPVTGAHLYAESDTGGAVIGAITSSTISPMLGAEPIALAVVKTAHAQPGTILETAADGARLRAAVQHDLPFLAPHPSG